VTVATLQFVPRPGILDLGWGHPRPELLPVEPWLAAQRASAATFGWQALTYGYAAGPAPLIEWLAARTASAPEQCFVTAGASHALDLVAGLLTEPRDVALVDEPTYHLALRILRDKQLRLADASGRGRLFYTVPTFGNPTGRSLPLAERQSLVARAKREGFTIVEDDTYRELVYDGAAPPSLWELSGGENVVRIGSFAKTVAPGLRLGWINAAPSLVERLKNLGYVDSGGGVNHATALTMATFATSGAYDEHLARIRGAYREQRDALCEALDVDKPAGGWFLWLPRPAGLTLAAAERRGVSYVDGSRFQVDGRSGHIRLSFSMLPPDQLVEAARRLRP
jgi:2-aminoadipate transaminase